MMLQLNCILAIKHEVVNERIEMLFVRHLNWITSLKAARHRTSPAIFSANISNWGCVQGSLLLYYKDRQLERRG
jgi:hypothetical protein